jgi:hypothetical protein
MIPQKLPPQLDEWRTEIESRAGYPIDWQPAPCLDGAMDSGWTERRPVIRYRDYSEAGVAEELLHLLLDLDGYPRLAADEIRTLDRTTATMLQNILQHAIIFPRLRALGYQPDQGECEATARQLRRLDEQKLDVSRLADEAALRALLAVFYVRVRRHCDAGEVQSRVDEMFAGDEFSEVHRLARGLTDAITLTASSSCDEYVLVGNRCIEILGTEISIADTLPWEE